MDRARPRALAAAGLAAAALSVAAAASVAAANGSGGFSASPSQISVGQTFTAAKSASGRIAQSDPSLLGRTDSALVNVMIKYDFDPTASYAGGVSGLAATSPRVTGKSLAANASAVAAYNRFASTQLQTIDSRVQQAVPGVTVGQRFTTVYGGVAARVPANQIDGLLSVP